ncbi:MAG: hypothetical protein PHE32_00465 [Candidatus Shapirobacteria bacterium]|nr:hypothetical protein [Candidatus Shapirobacteria bacterium]MDD4410169.1 hypothetical protein [Candidatus Shapirobacteria bacterium]
MKNKLFIFSLLITSAFIFSACSPNPNLIENQEEAIPTINQETGDETETQLLEEINADKDTSFDSDFTNLETELNN